jgi:hypothetical protein
MPDRDSLPRLSDGLLGSRWRDEHGNEFEVFSVYYKDDDPEISLKYVPPATQQLTLSQVKETHALVREGAKYER